MTSLLLTQIRLLTLSVTAIVLMSCQEQNNRQDKEIVTDYEANKVSELSKNVSCIFQDKHDNYWFGTNGDGLYRYDGKDLLRFTYKDGLCSNYILSIQEDREGNLWFATEESICKYDGVSFVDQINQLESAPQKKPVIRKGDILINKGNSIYHFDGESFSTFSIYPESYKPEPNNLDTPYGVYCILADQSNQLWFGTDQKGVCYYDGTSFTYFSEKGLGDGAVRAVFQDKHGHLWFGNNGYGLFHYDGAVLTNFTEKKGLGNPDFLKKSNLSNNTENLARVWAINEDKDGNLWIGTIDSGAWRYDGKNLKHYTTKDGLPNNKISSIYKDNKNNLWFITEGEGVSKFNGETFDKFIK